MSSLDLETYGDLTTFVASRVGATRPADLERIDFYCADALKKVWRRFQWEGRRRVVQLAAKKVVEVTVSVTKGDATVTRVSGDPFTSALVNAGFVAFGSPAYVVASRTNDDTVELDRPYFEASDSSLTAHFYWDTIELPADCAEIIEDEITLLVDKGKDLEWADETEGRRLSPFPSEAGAPWWVTPGVRAAGDDELYSVRSLRFGPEAFDDEYYVRVAYYCEYPALPATDPARAAAKILLPEGRRSLAAWHALSAAYSEHPFTDSTQAERFLQRYEAELGVAIAAEQDEATDVVYVEAFDR